MDDVFHIDQGQKTNLSAAMDGPLHRRGVLSDGMAG